MMSQRHGNGRHAMPPATWSTTGMAYTYIPPSGKGLMILSLGKQIVYVTDIEILIVLLFNRNTN